MSNCGSEESVIILHDRLRYVLGIVF
jgi:hypothetical protein